jgi:hypothetical protein
MRRVLQSALLLAAVFTYARAVRGADEKPLPQDWDYVGPMTKVAARFHGRPGVVIHLGDSITYSNPYGQWARAGQGQSAADKAALAWMHAGRDNDTDGWWLARFDHPAGGRSYTACSGLRADEMLAGGKQQMPPLEKLLDMYRPQIAVYMLGTNDLSAGRSLDAYRADVEKSIDLIFARGIIPILSTIPPHPAHLKESKAFNDALRALARRRGLPLIDFEREILLRRPNDWNGTLIGKDDVHPTSDHGGATAASAPTAENLRNSGYLLRGWLSVEKIAEVKRTVVDRLPAGTHEPDKTSFPSRPIEKFAIPAGRAVRLPVTRDTFFSHVGREADGNNGGATRLKLKSYQEMSVVDFDTGDKAERIKGQKILGALLHVRLAGSEPLRRVTVSSFAAPWAEGTASNYEPQAGSSCFNWKQYPGVPWTVRGSDLTAVMLGAGNTIWRMADATPPDAEGWQTVPVDPDVVAARVAGLSYGFLLFDDTGSEWTRDGEHFIPHPFPNRFVYSSKQNATSAPYLTVYLGAESREPPRAVTRLAVDKERTDLLPAGEAWITWNSPEADSADASAAALGFMVSTQLSPAQRFDEVPRYLIPLAGKPGEKVEMHLRDLVISPGARIAVQVRAVDRAGNIGPALIQPLTVSGREPQELPAASESAIAVSKAPSAKLPQLGQAEIAIIDELDKVQPVTGEMIPKRTDAYLDHNHLWDAKNRTIQLSAARNEFVAFQILIRGTAAGVVPELKFDGEKSPTTATFGVLRNVGSKRGPLPDPVVPLTGSFSIPAPDERLAGQRNGSLLCEIYVPHEAAGGIQRGTLTLRSADQKIELPVELHVWNFTLPDYLSFLPEMNCYGLPGSEREYYRLAHLHRTLLNVVPYHQSGAVEQGWAPRWTDGRFDWTAWDRRFGPYFDGTAFADLPRGGVPQEGFYLPLNENWPTPMEGNYNGDYWADRAFPKSYRDNFVEASRQMAEHFNARGWNDTLFQCFFNGKNNFKSAGWSRGSSPWLLDEPAHFQDFWALRYFGTAFHEGVNLAPGKAKLAFRCDISRPEWQRDALDGLLDYNVVGGAYRQYTRLVNDRTAAQKQVMLEYGNSNAVEDSNVQPAAWSIDSWTLGSDGVLPWLAVGNSVSWKTGEDTSLFYPARQGETGPTPSIRLKAYRRGQQDIEYLTLWAQQTGEPRWAIGQQVRKTLHLAPVRSGTGFTGDEDAGVIRFGQLLPENLWSLRMRIGEALDRLHPEPRRKLIDFHTPPRDLKNLAPGEVSFDRG